MPTLWSLDDAKRDLRVTSTSSDADISAKLEMASAMVLRFITAPDPEWTEATVPFPVKAAIMLTVRSLYDEDKSPGLPVEVKQMLRATGLRDPGLA